MSKAINDPGSNRDRYYVNQSEHYGVEGLPNERLSCSERTSVRRGTDGTIDSTSTFLSKNQKKDVELWTIELQSSANSSTLTPCPPSATVDENAGLPQERATPGRWQRLQLRWLTPYRVLITCIVAINLGTVVWQTVASSKVEAPLAATAANIMTAVLLRQEEMINISFKSVAKLSATLPLAARATIADFHHFGGVHIGCALSALLWYITFTVLNTIRVLHLLSQGDMTTMLYVDMVTAYAALLAILLVCMTAIPRFRVRCHNTFEITHRVGGWAALLVLWIHSGITTLTPDASMPLYAYPSLWMLAITTVLIIIPWLRIRRVPITTQLVSTKEVQVTFPFTNMPYTSTIRTSTAPLTEWHAFATIPVDRTTAKIIISNAGDWTKSIITSPPSHLWIRHPPTLNFLTFAPLFNSLLLVATGAGIGPMLSLLASPAINRMRSQGRKVKVMWCAAEPEAAHWAFVLAAIRNVDGEAVIFDSKARRPDLAFEARYLAVKKGVEAVMVVSNPKVTKEVVDECKMKGLAAYGAVFDS